MGYMPVPYEPVSGLTEDVQDVLGAILAPDTGDLDWTYDDAGNAESVIVKTTRSADTAVTQVATGLTGATAATRFVGGTTAGPPVTGTFAAGDYIVTQGGRVWVCTAAGTPGTWMRQATGEEATWSLPTGAKAETIPRHTIVNADASLLSTGRLNLVAIYLPAGVSVTTISFMSGTTAFANSSGTPNQWFALYDSSLALLKVTSDDGATAWAGLSMKTLTLSGGAFTTTYSGLYYLGICVVATTVPQLRAINYGSAVTPGLAPVLHGTSTTGLTTPGTAPNPALAPTVQSSRPYAYIS